MMTPRDDHAPRLGPRQPGLLRVEHIYVGQGDAALVTLPTGGVMLVAQRTLGGGDIRRQDMPFVSNRMNFTAAHAEVMYFLPGLSGLRLDLGAAHVLSGRNVGQSTTIMTGLTYAFHL